MFDFRNFDGMDRLSESGIPWQYDPKYWQYWQSVNNMSTGLHSNNDLHDVNVNYIQTISYWRYVTEHH